MPKVETEALRSAARSIREQVIPKFDDLKKMTDDTEVSLPHFGIALFTINGQYQEFREYLVKSINAARDKMDLCQAQIDEAAKHWDAVEAANAKGMKP